MTVKATGADKRDRTQMTENTQNSAISQVVNGKSFVDIGALWGTASEKASVAWTHGASEVSVVDILPLNDPMWTAFDEHLATLGSPPAAHISKNLDDVTDADPKWDVVHTSGVIYHCPSPMHTLGQLKRITGEHLIITSMVIPPSISSPTGTLTLRPGQSWFVPTLDAEARQIAGEYLNSTGVVGAWGIDVAVGPWDATDYGPWWWLFTPQSFRELVETAGFEVVMEGSSWEGRSHTVLARPV